MDQQSNVKTDVNYKYKYLKYKNKYLEYKSSGDSLDDDFSGGGRKKKR